MPSKYKRILLKLSGESLMGKKQFGIDPAMTKLYAKEIKSAVNAGAQVADRKSTLLNSSHSSVSRMPSSA